jgi:hypothetical protein
MICEAFVLAHSSLFDQVEIEPEPQPAPSDEGQTELLGPAYPPPEAIRSSADRETTAPLLACRLLKQSPRGHGP